MNKWHTEKKEHVMSSTIDDIHTHNFGVYIFLHQKKVSRETGKQRLAISFRHTILSNLCLLLESTGHKACKHSKNHLRLDFNKIFGQGVDAGTNLS